jgi:hypothetical protein
MPATKQLTNASALAAISGFSKSKAVAIKSFTITRRSFPSLQSSPSVAQAVGAS